MHLKILEHASEVVLTVDESANKIVGFVTAITDGVMCAYIPLLEVLPEYRGRGIGTELMRRMMQKLDDLYMTDLLCDERMVSFYTRFGMRKATGMMIRRYRFQAGREQPMPER